MACLAAGEEYDSSERGVRTAVYLQKLMLVSKIAFERTKAKMKTDKQQRHIDAEPKKCERNPAKMKYMLRTVGCEPTLS